MSRMEGAFEKLAELGVSVDIGPVGVYDCDVGALSPNAFGPEALRGDDGTSLGVRRGSRPGAVVVTSIE